MQDNDLREILAPVFDAVSENPMLAVIWIITFVILIGGFIFCIKAENKLATLFSFDAKVKKAKNEGRYVTGTRLEASYDSDFHSNIDHKTWYATYSYEVDGIEYKKKLMSWYDSAEPPLLLELYYDKNPKKVFTPYEYRRGGFFALPLLIWRFSPFILAALFLWATGVVKP